MEDLKSKVSEHGFSKVLVSSLFLSIIRIKGIK